MMNDIGVIVVRDVAACAGVLTATSLAYIGPGTGLSALGSLVAFLAAIIIALFGFVWFPIKRLCRRFRQKGQEPPLETKLRK